MNFRKFFKKKYEMSHAVLFIHGLAGGLKDWEKTIKNIYNENYFEIRYFDREKIYHNYNGEKVENWVWNCSFYSTNTLDDSINGNLTLFSERLKKIIQIVKNISCKDKVILIAHSMGGLISRKYMTINRECWESVHKLLTVATPNKGFGLSIGIIQQLRDLKRNSLFIKKLDEKWDYMIKLEKNNIWGVVGSINTKGGFTVFNDPKATDSAGIGYVEISSSIPYDEWAESVGKNIDTVYYNTEHFGFRAATVANHTDILLTDVVYKGIKWAINDYDYAEEVIL